MRREKKGKNGGTGKRGIGKKIGQRKKRRGKTEEKMGIKLKRGKIFYFSWWP